ncbi:hypothetical protein D2N39_00005 [Gemmobacter lutimaris]|uniref:Uncharacterized protein n=1 Tax=Gemmobacter lutimaris TaxID=2306023 RepID=A0A398BSD8_9RHOB|nr:hypothetical protein [Gemmobacter lutimaris]RID93352.1 hypothetical protein D2N39_00005 [Gemmobacter lutimaris]
MTAAGYYTLVHATTGATMLGSTAAGASAAGTVGIIAGTGGGIGAVAAFITAPATIVVAGVAAVGTGGFEVVCYFKDERITDYDEVLERLKLLEKSNPELVRFTYGGVNPKLSEVVLKTSEGEKRYKIKKLYIVNGMLMHRDWGRNTKIGQLAFIVAPPPESGKK